MRARGRDDDDDDDERKVYSVYVRVALVGEELGGVIVYSYIRHMLLIMQYEEAVERGRYLLKTRAFKHYRSLSCIV